MFRLLSRGFTKRHPTTPPHHPAPHPAPGTNHSNAPTNQTGNHPGTGNHQPLTNTHTTTPTPKTPGLLSRAGGAVGGVVRDYAVYGAIGLGVGYLLDNYVYHTPGPLDGPDGGGDGPLGTVTGAAEAFMHGAGDTLGFLASIPGDIVEGIAGAAGTAQTVTYLLTAGVLIGGAVYLYNE